MWYYSVNNQQFGPLDEETIKRMIANQTIRAGTLVWQQGMPGWLPAGSTRLAPFLAPNNQIAPPVAIQQIPYGEVFKTSEMQAKEMDTLFMWAWICLIGMIITFGVSGIASVVLFYIILYRSWKVIQDGYAHTTPGNAVGMCFVPFYNFYWIFQAFPGLAKDTNAYIQRHNLPIARQDETLPLVYCILTLFTAAVSWIPYVGLILVIPVLVIEIIMFKNFRDAAVAILRMSR